MTIVDEAARIIDPDAFSEIAWIDGATGKPHDFGDSELALKNLHKARAIHRAVTVLKLALATPNLKKLLIEDEISRWESLGIPKEMLDTHEVAETIANKYAGK